MEDMLKLELYRVKIPCNIFLNHGLLFFFLITIHVFGYYVIFNGFLSYMLLIANGQIIMCERKVELIKSAYIHTIFW